MRKSLRVCKWAFAAWAVWVFAANAQQAAHWQGPPFVSVEATDPLASEPGDNPATFSIFRTGDTNSALTIDFSLGGTAKNGTDYVAVPTNVTLSAGQCSTNITITPISEPQATGYKTVKLTLERERFEKGDSAPLFVVGSLNHALVYIVYNYTNVPPGAKLVTPTNSASFLSRPNIVLGATSSDSNGWVTAVQFLANGSVVGTVSNSPFSHFPLQPLVMREARGSVVPVLPGERLNRFQFVWTNVPPGAYALEAVALDNAGLQTTSAPVDITVTTNLPAPEVRIINPVKGAVFPDEAPIYLFAAAGETNGVVNTVEFFSNGSSVGTATNYLATEPLFQTPYRLQWLPFNLLWTNAPVGSNVLTAVATDNNGTTVTSAPVTISVTTNLFHHHHPWW